MRKNITQKFPHAEKYNTKTLPVEKHNMAIQHAIFVFMILMFIYFTPGIQHKKNTGKENFRQHENTT